MRQLSSPLSQHLASGSTNLCHCWKILRKDGTILGFTDHDLDVTFNGQVYLARSGAEISKLDAALGLSVSGAELTGALTSDALTGDDLVNGLYDNATVETWLVNWSDPSQTLLLDISTLGEVKRGDFGFTAELRSLAHAFDQETGRRFQKSCSADLGDAQCGVSLAGAAFTTSGTISTTNGPMRFNVSLPNYASGWFLGGKITFSSGVNAGLTRMIKADFASADLHTLEIWAPLANAPMPGDVVSLQAGCDKSFATCRAKFANSVNFRGFPHMPGNDLITSYVSQKDPALDGGSMNK